MTTSRDDFSVTEKRMKVTDRRMFTADGELRDEYKDTVDPDRVPAETAPPRAVREDEPPAHIEPSPEGVAEHAAPEPAEPPADEDARRGPQFADLVAFLAQTAAAYLQQARQGTVGGAMGAGELLEMASLHVDLLDVLERKTAGNLEPQEHAMLDDARRQLRLALG